MANTPAYLKDTKDTIIALNEITVEVDCILITADVSSLYTKIPHDRALAAVNFFLDGVTDITMIQKKFILTLLNFYMSHNYFWYDNQFFSAKKRCCHGCQVCSQCGQSFHCPLGGSDHLWHTKKGADFLVSLYRLFIWKGTVDTLILFMEELNTNELGIKWNYEYSH